MALRDRAGFATLALVGAVMGVPAAAQDRSASDPAWETRAAMPTSRLEMAAGVVEGRVHVVGGLAADGATLATVEVYDPAADRWAPGVDLPEPLHHAMAATLNEELYVAGGYDAGSHATRRVHRLGPDGWLPIAPLPLARAAGTMVALGGNLWLAGGIDLTGGLGREMQVYDPIFDEWSVVAGPPTPREHLAGGVVDGRLVTVGGRVVRDQVGVVEVFDLMTEEWSRLADLPTPRAGLGATPACDGRLVAIGGEDIRGVADRAFAEVEAYDPATDTWSRLPDLPAPRHGIGVVATGPTLLAIGGGEVAGLAASDTVLALDLTGLPGCRGTVRAP